MTTNLTGRDLLIMHNIITDRLRICNISQDDRDECTSLGNKIVDILEGVEIELKKPKGKK